MRIFILTILSVSFLFSGISFNKSISFSNFDDYPGALGVVSGDSFGVDFDLNDVMSLGYDSNIGMLVKANNLPVGLILRLGISNANNVTTNTIGLGYDWWTGGEIIKTTLGTNIDYSSRTKVDVEGDDPHEIFISINIGWGF